MISKSYVRQLKRKSAMAEKGGRFLLVLFLGGNMTLPHRYIENQFARLSRGTLNGLPLLMPGKNSKLCNQIRDIFLRDAARFNITILALNVEPFGYEAIIFDPNMRRSDLLKSVNQCISMKVKKTTNHRESVWSNRKPENVPILDLVSLENEIFDVCISPAKKGYVKTLLEWVLPRIGPEDWPMGETEENSKHENKIETTESVAEDLTNFSLQNTALGRGPGLLKSDLEQSDIARLRSALIARISEFEDACEANSHQTLGAEACRLKGSFSKQSVQNWEAYCPSKQLAICASEDRLCQLVHCLTAYYDAYRRALAAFIATKVSTFPAGILKMRTLFKLTSLPISDNDPFHFKV